MLYYPYFSVVCEINPFPTWTNTQTDSLIPVIPRKHWLCGDHNKINPLPNDKILDQSDFKALADDKRNVTKKLKFVLGMVENNLGKGEIAGYKHFLLFPKCFQKPPISESLKVGIVLEIVNAYVAKRS